MKNIYAVIGLILTIALTIVLSTGRYAGLFRTAPGQQAALILEDFDYFFRTFEQTHPEPYSAFGGERSFHKKVKSLRRALSRTEGLDADRLQAEFVSAENVYGLYGAVSGWQMNSAMLSLMFDDFDGEKVEMEFRTVSDADTTVFLPLFTDALASTPAPTCSIFLKSLFRKAIKY